MSQYTIAFMATSPDRRDPRTGMQHVFPVAAQSADNLDHAAEIGSRYLTSTPSQMVAQMELGSITQSGQAKIIGVGVWNGSGLTPLFSYLNTKDEYIAMVNPQAAGLQLVHSAPKVTTAAPATAPARRRKAALAVGGAD